MISSALNRLQAGVDGACAYLDANQAARNLVEQFSFGLEQTLLESHLDSLSRIAPSSTSWRVFDHCAAMSRLYALFEQFCETVLADWLEFRTNGVLFSTLPEALQKAYAEGFPSILQEAKKVQYDHLLPAEMISQYNNALKGELDYRLAAECLTFHKGNIRWPDIDDMFSHCGILNLGPWVNTHKSLISHFQGNKKILEQTKSKLSQFVKFRNDSVHSLVALDEILGRDQIVEYADFIKSFCNCLHELVHHSAISYLISIGKATEVGIITEEKRGNVVICNIQGATIKVDDEVHLLSDRLCSTRRVQSLMLNDVSTDIAVIATATELGMRFDSAGFVRAKVVILVADVESLAGQC